MRALQHPVAVHLGAQGVSGVRGAGVIEPRSGPVETAIDRFGGDYRSFEIKNDDKAERGDT